ncbi:TPA: IS3 family transposase, partial [Pseudomonas aeruginosa]
RQNSLYWVSFRSAATIRRKIYSSRQDARADVFDYIEMFYNPKRRHGFNNQLSPVEFEKRYFQSLESV